MSRLIHIAFIGSRNFTNKIEFTKIALTFIKKLGLEIGQFIVVSGGANGADKIAEEWAQIFNIETLIFKAEWDNLVETPDNPVQIVYHGPNNTNPYNCLAGFNRNTKIVENSDIVCAVWDEKSSGTKDSLDKAIKLGKKCLIYNFLTKEYKEYYG